MREVEAPFVEYGEGSEYLFAFHGYGMDGNQYRTLNTSLIPRYRIVGFHLPYHNDGPISHFGWIEAVVRKMRVIISEQQPDHFSLAGYSFGAKIALHLLPLFQNQITNIYLFAPFGLENHWGLHFFSRGLGHLIFKNLIKSSLPIKITNASKSLGIIDDDHLAIINRELDTEYKRHNLCYALFMTSEIKIEALEIIRAINDNEISATIVYGDYDVIFPHNKRNRKLLSCINNCDVLSVEENHWLITEKLDQLLNESNP